MRSSSRPASERGCDNGTGPSPPGTAGAVSTNGRGPDERCCRGDGALAGDAVRRPRRRRGGRDPRHLTSARGASRRRRESDALRVGDQARRPAPQTALYRVLPGRPLLRRVRPRGRVHPGVGRRRQAPRLGRLCRDGRLRRPAVCRPGVSVEGRGPRLGRRRPGGGGRDQRSPAPTVKTPGDATKAGP
jgi:hypothetical protein